MPAEIGDDEPMDATAGVRLTRSGLTLTRLGLGCAPIGGLFEPVSDADAHAVVDRAWEHGLRLFDTAPLYGSGLSERRLGHALGERPRDELVLSTKVGRVLRAGGKPDAVFEGALPFEPVSTSPTTVRSAGSAAVSNASASIASTSSTFTTRTTTSTRREPARTPHSSGCATKASLEPSASA
jgi:hypothetical protein